MMRHPAVLILCCLLLLVATTTVLPDVARSEILTIDRTIPTQGEYDLIARFAVWSLQDAPLWPLNQKQPFVHVQARLKWTGNEEMETENSTLFYVLIYHIDDSRYIGIQDPQSEDQQLVKCYSNGTLALSPELLPEQYDRIVRRIQFPTKKDILSEYQVTRTGFHVAELLKCSDTPSEIDLTVNYVVLNPYGYLPGFDALFLPFYFVLTAFYLIIGLVWIISNLLHWHDLLKLQTQISQILLLGLIEAAICCIEYSIQNFWGFESNILVTIAIVLHLARKTFSRTLVLIVSMGYGVVKPTLGTTAYNVIIYSFLYFIAACAQQIIMLLFSRVSFLTFVGAIPVALVDMGFYVWIFMSLSITLSFLEKKQQTAKLQLYTRFKWVLIVYVLASTGWSIYEILFMLSGDVTQNNRWQRVWVFDAFWEVLFLFVLCAVMLLWRPTKNNTRYAYSEEISIDDHHELLETEAQAESEPAVILGEGLSVRTTAVAMQQGADTDASSARVETPPVSSTQHVPTSSTIPRAKNPLAGFALLDEEDTNDDTKLE